MSNGQNKPSVDTDDERVAARVQQEENAKSACLCTIINPGKRAQVIYDGITNAKPIMFAPNETKHDVRLAEHMVARLQEQEKLGDDPDNYNLRVVDWKSAPLDAVLAARPSRKPRPVRAAAA
jgi:hypothetical protein